MELSSHISERCLNTRPTPEAFYISSNCAALQRCIASESGDDKTSRKNFNRLAYTTNKLLFRDEFDNSNASLQGSKTESINALKRTNAALPRAYIQKKKFEAELGCPPSTFLPSLNTRSNSFNANEKCNFRTVEMNHPAKSSNFLCIPSLQSSFNVLSPSSSSFPRDNRTRSCNETSQDVVSSLKLKHFRHFPLPNSQSSKDLHADTKVDEYQVKTMQRPHAHKSSWVGSADASVNYNPLEARVPENPYVDPYLDITTDSDESVTSYHITDPRIISAQHSCNLTDNNNLFRKNVSLCLSSPLSSSTCCSSNSSTFTGVPSLNSSTDSLPRSLQIRAALAKTSLTGYNTTGTIRQPKSTLVERKLTNSEFSSSSTKDMSNESLDHIQIFIDGENKDTLATRNADLENISGANSEDERKVFYDEKPGCSNRLVNERQPYMNNKSNRRPVKSDENKITMTTKYQFDYPARLNEYLQTNKEKYGITDSDSSVTLKNNLLTDLMEASTVASNTAYPSGKESYDTDATPPRYPKTSSLATVSKKNKKINEVTNHSYDINYLLLGTSRYGQHTENSCCTKVNTSSRFNSTNNLLGPQNKAYSTTNTNVKPKHLSNKNKPLCNVTSNPNLGDFSTQNSFSDYTKRFSRKHVTRENSLPPQLISSKLFDYSTRLSNNSIRENHKSCSNLPFSQPTIGVKTISELRKGIGQNESNNDTIQLNIPTPFQYDARQNNKDFIHTSPLETTPPPKFKKSLIRGSQTATTPRSRGKKRHNDFNSVQFKRCATIASASPRYRRWNPEKLYQQAVSTKQRSQETTSNSYNKFLNDQLNKKNTKQSDSGRRVKLSYIKEDVGSTDYIASNKTLQQKRVDLHASNENNIETKFRMCGSPHKNYKCKSGILSTEQKLIPCDKAIGRNIHMMKDNSFLENHIIESDNTLKQYYSINNKDNGTEDIQKLDEKQLKKHAQWRQNNIRLDQLYEITKKIPSNLYTENHHVQFNNNASNKCCSSPQQFYNSPIKPNTSYNDTCCTNFNTENKNEDTQIEKQSFLSFLCNYSFLKDFIQSKENRLYLAQIIVWAALVTLLLASTIGIVAVFFIYCQSYKAPQPSMEDLDFVVVNNLDNLQRSSFLDPLH